jgi:protein-tyrosine phosphatase
VRAVTQDASRVRGIPVLRETRAVARNAATCAAMKVLFVCLGNICRSPTAEGVTRGIAAREFPALEIEVDSAGTADYHVGEPPDRRSVEAARRRGCELAGLRARQISAADFSRFDYVLAMDRANLAQLEQRGARGRAHLGLFLEFARAETAEVPDPYYGGAADFERVLDLCELGARALLMQLAKIESIKKPAHP